MESPSFFGAAKEIVTSPIERFFMLPGKMAEKMFTEPRGAAKEITDAVRYQVRETVNAPAKLIMGAIYDIGRVTRSAAGTLLKGLTHIPAIPVTVGRK